MVRRRAGAALARWTPAVLVAALPPIAAEPPPDSRIVLAGDPGWSSLGWYASAFQVTPHSDPPERA